MYKMTLDYTYHNRLVEVTTQSHLPEAHIALSITYATLKSQHFIDQSKKNAFMLTLVKFIYTHKT